MELLKLDFLHFWPHFNKENNLFVNTLRNHYNVVIDPNPQLLIFTNDNCGTREYLNYKCHKLFVGLENERTDFTSCDFAIDFDYLNHPNHLRMPLWAFWNLESLTHPKQFTVNDINYRKDCCMVVSNANAKERIQFYQKLKQHIHIDMGGKYLNNVGGPIEYKMEFIKNYKFVISFENSSHPGYVTEKLIEPMLANTIPIYWGDPTVNNDFNHQSFINIHNYQSSNHAINDIVSLVKNPHRYVELLNQPWFFNNLNTEKKYKTQLEQFLIYCTALTFKTTPVSNTYKATLHQLNLKKNTAKNLLLNKLKRNFR
jgi:hypothetical protein